MRYSAVSAVGKSIVVVGMMGAGKSSVGRCLQRQTKLPLFDTDKLAAASFGISIREIFSKFGEEKFREAETQAVRQLSESTPAIIVTGGGVILREENLRMLKRLGVIVWLDANEEVLFERASRARNRPLLQSGNSRESFAGILNARRLRYAKIAHVRVDTSMLTSEEVAMAILTKLKRLEHNRHRDQGRQR